jgi:hypothetical protein
VSTSKSAEDGHFRGMGGSSASDRAAEDAP